MKEYIKKGNTDDITDLNNMASLQKRRRYNRACAGLWSRTWERNHTTGSSNINHWKQILKIFRDNKNKRKVQT